MKRSKGMQLGALLAAMLLLSIALVPAVGATQTNNGGINKENKKNNSDNASIQSVSTTATLGVTPTTGNLSTTFFFNAQATYTLDVYGIPLPGPITFDHDISYTAFHQPVVTATSFSSPSFVYKASSPIGPSWNFYWSAWVLGGPDTEYINSHTWPKAKGSYNNRLYSSIYPASISQDTKTVLIS